VDEQLLSPSHNQVSVACSSAREICCLLPSESQDVSAWCVQAQIASEQERLANTRVQPDCALSLQANEISQQHMSTASSLLQAAHHLLLHSVGLSNLVCAAAAVKQTVFFAGNTQLV